MADLDITETTVKNIPSLVKAITLTAGGKLGDDAQLTAWAAKTCPAGYEIDVNIRIMVKAIRSV